MPSPAPKILYALAIAEALAPVAPAHAATYTDAYSFCSVANCTDGSYPAAPLVADSSGNLFGTTAEGGTGGWGTVFELVSKKGAYTYKVLHSFCLQANCADGQDPVAGVIVDTDGNLYGTTKFGGTQNGGTVFELVHGRRYRLKILHSFCSEGAACADGSLPMYDGLTYAGAQNGTPYDGISPLYGTTLYGGEYNSGFSGTIFTIAPRRAGRRWKESVIWQFCSQTGCPDGSQSHDGLVMDNRGNLYGVTFAGGNVNNDGVIFELSPAGKTWNETVLYDFCSAAACADGRNPQSPLLPTANGFVGSASGGGGSNDAGTLYSLVPNGANSKFAALYAFCPQAGCSDGDGPMGRLAMDASGDLFGTAVDGGDPNSSRGVIFELPNQGALNVLHTFCAGGNCSDGAWPIGGVTLDGVGRLLGTVSEGGAHSDGAIFQVTPYP